MATHLSCNDELLCDELETTSDSSGRNKTSLVIHLNTVNVPSLSMKNNTKTSEKVKVERKRVTFQDNPTDIDSEMQQKDKVVQILLPPSSDFIVSSRILQIIQNADVKETLEVPISDKFEVAESIEQKESCEEDETFRHQVKREENVEDNDVVKDEDNGYVEHKDNGAVEHEHNNDVEHASNDHAEQEDNEVHEQKTSIKHKEKEVENVTLEKNTQENESFNMVQKVDFKLIGSIEKKAGFKLEESTETNESFKHIQNIEHNESFKMQCSGNDKIFKQEQSTENNENMKEGQSTKQNESFKQELSIENSEIFKPEQNESCKIDQSTEQNENYKFDQRNEQNKSCKIGQCIEQNKSCKIDQSTEQIVSLKMEQSTEHESLKIDQSTEQNKICKIGQSTEHESFKIDQSTEQNKSCKIEQSTEQIVSLKIEQSTEHDESFKFDQSTEQKKSCKIDQSPEQNESLKIQTEHKVSFELVKSAVRENNSNVKKSAQLKGSFNTEESIEQKECSNVEENTEQNESFNLTQSIQEKESVNLEEYAELKENTNSEESFKITEKYAHNTESHSENNPTTTSLQISSFRSQYCEAVQSKAESLKLFVNQASIPEARLAFVTEMVENSRTEYECNTDSTDSNSGTSLPAVQETGSNPKDGCYVVSIELTDEDISTVEQIGIANSSLGTVTMEFDEVLMSHQKTQEKESPALYTSTLEVVVDRSSILERKNEIKQLWENKMMANEQTEIGIKASMPKTGEDPEEDIQVNATDKTPNGTVPDGKAKASGNPTKPLDDTNGESIVLESNKTDEIKLEKMNGEPLELNEDSNSAEHHEKEVLVELNSELTVEPSKEIQNGDELDEVSVERVEKIYTSSLEHTLVMSSNMQKTCTEIHEVVVKENNFHVEESVKDNTIQEVKLEKTEEYSTIASNDSSENVVRSLSKNELHSDLIVLETSSEKQVISAKSESKVIANNIVVERVEKVSKPPDLALDVANSSEDFELFEFRENKDEDSKERESDLVDGNEELESEILIADIEDNISEIPSEGVSIDPDNDLEIEQPILETIISDKEEQVSENHSINGIAKEVLDDADKEKKGSPKDKHSRIQPAGVQKTEQPYSTCTTETKIAMEIREMREREEELKVMRERQALSPVQPPSPQSKTTPKIPEFQKATPQRNGYSPVSHENIAPGPGYRVSSVFGHKGSPNHSPADEDQKAYRTFNKESPVEKEIRIARDREEELRKQKGLPPREDDSYVKPSQVKSSQVKVFSKMNNSNNSKHLATTKIQHEIEEQTMREMALRETGHIQTISQERTDAKVTKLKVLDIQAPECISPTLTNGNSTPPTNGTTTNGTTTNGHISPDCSSKRSTPSPTGSNHSSTHPVPRSFLPGPAKGISMQKFINSRGRESTFAAPRNGPFSPKADYSDASRSIPPPGKLKRTVSVESKIQQEIMEMKMREEELKLLHSGPLEPPLNSTENGTDQPVAKSSQEYQNGQSVNENEENCPRRSNLIAQWEQRIQNAEGRA